MNSPEEAEACPLTTPWGSWSKDVLVPIFRGLWRVWMVSIFQSHVGHRTKSRALQVEVRLATSECPACWCQAWMVAHEERS